MFVHHYAIFNQYNYYNLIIERYEPNTVLIHIIYTVYIFQRKIIHFRESLYKMVFFPNNSTMKVFIIRIIYTVYISQLCYMCIICRFIYLSDDCYVKEAFSIMACVFALYDVQMEASML